MSARVVARQSVVSCEIASGFALLDVDSNTYFSLNATGALIWAQLAEPRDIDALCAAVSESFEISPEQCRPDVIHLVERLVSRGLAETVEDGGH